MPKKDSNKLQQPTQCTSTSLLYSDMWFNNIYVYSTFIPTVCICTCSVTSASKIRYHMIISIHILLLFRCFGVEFGVGWSWLLSSYTSKWSRDVYYVQVHCIGFHNLFQFLFGVLTCTFFSKKLFSLLVCIFCLHYQCIDTLLAF